MHTGDLIIGGIRMNFFDLPVKELKVYKPNQTKAEDFDLFWDSIIKESKAQPLNTEYIAMDYPVEQIKVYDVYYDGFRNSRIHGRLILPAAASKDNKVPVVVMYYGYNWNNRVISHTFKYLLLGYGVFIAEVRGQNVTSPDHNHYDNGGASGWMTLGIYNHKNYYYLYVYMDCARIIDLLMQREDIDTNRIAVEGGSQGGALSLAVAALCPEVKVVMADCPFLCHFKRAVELAQEYPYLEISHFFKIHDSLHKTEEQVYKTLSYFDNMNLASRIKGEVLMSVGLEDAICPPSTCFAAFNHIQSNKEMRIYPDYGHGGFSQQEEERLIFLKKRFDKEY